MFVQDTMGLAEQIDRVFDMKQVIDHRVALRTATQTRTVRHEISMEAPDVSQTFGIGLLAHQLQHLWLNVECVDVTWCPASNG